MTIREFTRNIYTYMKPGEYVVTKNNKEFMNIVMTDMTFKEKNMEGITIVKTEKGKLDIINYPKKLKIKPAQCKKCSFTFKERSKVKKPGRCPKCKSEWIMAPLFRIGQ